MKDLKHTNKSWIEEQSDGIYNLQITLPVSDYSFQIVINQMKTTISDHQGIVFEEMDLQEVLTDFLQETIEESNLIQEKLALQERTIDGAVSKDELETLLELNQDVHYLKASLSSLEKIILFISNYCQILTPVDKLNFDLSSDEIIFKLETIQSVIDSLVDVSDLIYSQKQNNYVKRLSILTILFSIPTFVTSFYGMNIALPFQTHPYLPFILVILSLSLILLTVILIRHLESD